MTQPRYLVAIVDNQLLPGAIKQALRLIGIPALLLASQFWRNALRRTALPAIICILVYGMGNVDALAGSPAQPSQRVLVLYSDDRLLPANIALDEAMRATFAASTNHQVEVYSEFFDRTRFPGPEQEQIHRDFFRGKYRQRPPHLVIAVSGAALAFAVKYRTEIFAGAPIVYCSAPGDAPPPELRDAAVGQVPLVNAAAPTLELALRLHPDTRLVAVVSGSSPRDVELAAGLHSEIPAFEKRVAFAWLTNQSLAQLRDELSRLPDHSIVLFHTMFQDAEGRTFLPRQALAEFAPASRAPIYGYYDTYLGYGITGGSMVTFGEIGRVTARLGIRILAGEDGQTVARSESHQAIPMFDWNQLRRWNISERNLPPGSVIRFRPPTLWEGHKDYVIGGLVIFFAQAVTIAALLVQRYRRRLAEAITREDEKRMALAADAVKLGLWMWDIPRNHLWVSARGKQLFGYPPEASLTLEMLRARVHPADRAVREETIQRALAGTGDYDPEYRVQLPDGSVRWLAAHGHVEFNPAGEPVLMRGVSVDITERKQAGIEIQQQRAELVHVARVSTMGQLASSLAHELNQPLGAILRNAEAAELFLQNDRPDLEEIRAILVDIRRDDQRAGAVIDRMRAMIKRREFQGSRLDLNALAGEVVTLVKPDAEGRKMKLALEPASTTLTVWGDRVQLQQVVLNLLLNAMDAINHCPPEARRVSVCVRRVAAGVEVAVSDAGRGIPEADLKHIFDPFFTTKTNGLGMGLAISQTIIAAHGGRIIAENNTSGGATFRVTMPAAKPEGGAA